VLKYIFPSVKISDICLRDICVKDSAHQNFYKTLGARIRELRGSKLSQEELARSVKLTRTSIVNIESGRQKLLVHNLFLIADALRVRPTDLLKPLEPSSGEIPKINIPGEAATVTWVKRSLSKAIKKHPSP
jgi:transcriptional regulator with XRE-family HTH domain